MAVLKCKMCGASLDVTSGAAIAICVNCGAKQTLPRLKNDRLADLYDRAGQLRQNNEFDKASDIYRQILSEDGTDAEAYWSLVLCRYGIQYAEDPATHRRVPTVSRDRSASIFDDENYRTALKYADSERSALYTEEATTISKIQKGILTAPQTEGPFDVYICCMETDQNGARTPDSVLAGELYQQLTKEGFKVFFPRVSLDGKSGSASESGISAALQSAKVMVAVGTKPEYFNAPAVKNEWSRFLALCKEDGGKMLIPAYRDMDPYDLPAEFPRLQAQDMAKLSFMQDLIRGMKEIVHKEAPKPPAVKETASAGGDASTAPLLKRAFMFLEDGDWNAANEYCEKVLDQDPENARAYLGKLMAELKVTRQEALKDCARPFDDRSNYQKALRFGDDALKQALTGYIEQINRRDENARKENYNSAVALMKAGDVHGAIRKYASSRGYQKNAEIIEAWRKENARTIAAGETHTVGLKDDGSVVAVGNNGSGQCNVKGWRDIVAIAAGEKHTVGLKSDGTVVAVGWNDHFQCNVSGWRDIVAIAAGEDHTVGLKSDGTVVVAGKNERDQCNVGDWRDIVAIAAGNSHTVGLKPDGSVVAAGWNDHRQCDVGDFHDIVAIAAGSTHTVGLKPDGRVMAVGSNFNDQCEVKDWNNIVSVAAGNSFTFGLKLDGTVAVAGNLAGAIRSDVEDWYDIVAIAAGRSHAIGLRSGGKVLSAGYKFLDDSGKYNVDDWYTIKRPKLPDAMEKRQKEVEKRQKEEQERKNKATYARAKEAMASAKTAEAFSDAAKKFKSISGYEDADTLAKECEDRAEAIQKELKQAAEEAKQKRNRRKGIVKSIVWVVLLAIALSIIFFIWNTYNSAVKLMNEGKYEEAISEFEKLDSFSTILDSKKKIEECNTAIQNAILDGKYGEAVALMEAGRYEEAVSAFEATNGYKDSVEKIDECNYIIATSLMEAGDVFGAIQKYMTCYDFQKNEEIIETWREINASMIAAGTYHTLGIKSDGSVVAVGDYDDGQFNVEGWSDIVSVAVGGYQGIVNNSTHMVGLKADGTVVAAGNNISGECDVEGWRDIVAISAGDGHTVGLKLDGTVVAVGSNASGQCNVEDWHNIVAIAAGDRHTVGLKSDGTVVAVGSNYNDPCNVENWSNIVAIAAAESHTVGLKSDGTVVAVGWHYYGQCDVEDWNDIVAITAVHRHTVGLKSDGTVVAVGENDYNQCDVEGWHDIVAIATGISHTVGLKSDGTMVAVGDNHDGQCDVEGWSDIQIPQRYAR